MEIRTSEGVKLSFDIAGTDSPSFLFVHGGGADRSHLAPQFDFFLNEIVPLTLTSEDTEKAVDRRNTAPSNNMRKIWPVFATSLISKRQLSSGIAWVAW
jgi:hypothetical protein